MEIRMDKLIAEFPENITESLEIGARADLKKKPKGVTSILICGLGGSGIGGSLISKWVESECAVPVNVSKEYTIPAYVNESTLVICSSYSGNTEETLDSVDSALKAGAQVVGITSGGKLLEICKEHGLDHVVVPGGNPPRSALAYSLIQLANILVQYGFIDEKILKQIEKARMLLMQEEKSIKKKAMEIAKFFAADKVPVLYSTSDFGPVLVRARQQINENGKRLCWHHIIPEMNHNELVGWGLGDDRYAVLFLDSLWINGRNKKRLELTREIVGTKTNHVKTVSGVGNSLVEQSLYFINLLDWTSFYMAEMGKVDAVEVNIIDYLKGELAKM
jgi:glucose/mannose-6-phosphate isomerase